MVYSTLFPRSVPGIVADQSQVPNSQAVNPPSGVNARTAHEDHPVPLTASFTRYFRNGRYRSPFASVPEVMLIPEGGSPASVISNLTVRSSSVYESINPECTGTGAHMSGVGRMLLAFAVIVNPALLKRVSVAPTLNPLNL